MSFLFHTLVLALGGIAFCLSMVVMALPTLPEQHTERGRIFQEAGRYLRAIGFGLLLAVVASLVGQAFGGFAL